MLANYFKVAWRNLLKRRQFTLLNISGLAAGMACALLIYLWVHDEWRMDKFHEKDERLYQVIEHAPNARQIITSEHPPGVLAAALAEEMPEVEYAASVRKGNDFILSAGTQNIRANGIYAEKDFFHIFSYPLLQGSQDQALADNNSLVISEALALRLFHTTANAIGKTVMLQHEQPYRVSGIFKGTPSNSSMQFDLILPFEAFVAVNPNARNWKYNTSLTYLTLHKGAAVAPFQAKIAGLIARKTGDSSRILAVRPYSRTYLYGQYENGVQTGGRITYVRLFSIIAVFILLIACINFMNLSTAKASGRMKEIGIRKAIGAGRSTLVLQYLGESMLMAFLSLLAALLLVMLLLPTFNSITGKQLSLQTSPPFILAFLCVAVTTGLIAGSYPALYLSGFNPVSVLKGRLPGAFGELFARKGLVVFQFTLSVVLIVAVLVVYRQITYIQTKQLGYNRDNILYFDREGNTETNLEGFLTAVKQIPGVVNASSIGQNIVGSGLNTIGDVEWDGKQPDEKVVFEIRPVNYDMIEMLGIQPKAGRLFSRKFGADETSLIFNETAVKMMGLQDPVGKTIRIQGGKFQIAGVVKDFHFASLHEKVSPLFFILRPGWTHKIMIKIAAGREKATIQQLQALYQQYNPGFPFEHQFLDKDYQQQYIAEERVAALSKYFAALAVLISCLGLFGLAAFTAERRQKEIGIRKVLGATVSQVVLMLSKDFLRSVLLAILIAVPLAWWAIHKWLQGFAYHIQVGADVFLIAGGVMVLITLLTVSFRAVKAAVANPVRSLKVE